MVESHHLQYENHPNVKYWVDECGNREEELQQWMLDEPNVRWIPMFGYNPPSQRKHTH